MEYHCKINQEEYRVNAELLREKVDGLCRQRAYDQIETILLQYKDITERDNDLAMVYYLMKIYKQEKAAGQKNILEKTGSISALLERYTILKFYLRRIEFDVIGESLQDFFRFIAHNEVSVYELLTVMEYSVVSREKVRRIIQGTV